MSNTEDKKGFSLDIVELQDYQQNRYPYLLIDHVDEVIPGVSAKGFKNFTFNEWFFPKHFEGAPNVPGAIQLESLAQMITIAITTLPELKGKTTRFISADLKFTKEIVPGNKLEIETKVDSWKRGLLHGTGFGYVDGELAVQAKMVISVPDIFLKFIPPKKK
jgi:3-hydroxyacyl-[acyl-carrier-protein] dehydratase